MNDERPADERPVEARAVPDLPAWQHAGHLLAIGPVGRVVRRAALVVAAPLTAWALLREDPMSVALAVTAAVNVLLPPRVLRRRLLRLWQANPGLPAVVHTFWPEGLSIQDGASHRWYHWCEVDDLVVDDQVVAVRLRGSRLTAMPRAALAAQALETVERWRVAGGGRRSGRWHGVDPWPPILLAAALVPLLPG